ncbi:hypothetical protein KSF_085870 [Reticulibacter mediterranei]|uniref:Uncharacterized protein n=1 Tax=Reticulibacter mediterranei TaxID=2778369 RepID=A0A8J3IVC6_9CHLR|nr:hypothetical protein [Reticulibacter mediterranei]GHO98539.1 hypothetical protein KSF_085870 [Reticulibacter mediterranei]
MTDEATGLSQGEQGGKRLAVVVDVNGQPASGRVPLHYAVEDAKVMAQGLQREVCGLE